MEILGVFYKQKSREGLRSGHLEGYKGKKTEWTGQQLVVPIAQSNPRTKE